MKSLRLSRVVSLFLFLRLRVSLYHITLLDILKVIGGNTALLRSLAYCTQCRYLICLHASFLLSIVE
uniref:Secreted protein n=1 Tax=Rhizophora mucronata TaxID=61149 RepID=A0A2P2IR50_RHIMU